MSLTIPERLRSTCSSSPVGMAWLGRLPEALRELERRCSLTLEEPFDGPEVSVAWVAPALRADGTPAVLKFGMPHMEAEHEIDGLRFWDGDPTVRLLEADDALGAMLLERCEPGMPLRPLPEVEQDVVVAGLLRRLWRVPAVPHPFRPLSTIARFADLFEVDPERVGSWMFARAAAEFRGEWDESWMELARALGP